MLKLSLSIFSLACALPTLANPAEGFFVTIDDETGEERGLVELRLVDSEMKGFLRGSFDPTEDFTSLCETCSDELQNQPVFGLPFVWGLEANGKRKFKGGRIQDPESGKTYKSKLKFNDDFSEVELRGYIGSPLLGRTQVWRRATDLDVARINTHNATYGLPALADN